MILRAVTAIGDKMSLDTFLFTRLFYVLLTSEGGKVSMEMKLRVHGATNWGRQKMRRFSLFQHHPYVGNEKTKYYAVEDTSFRKPGEKHRL